MKYFFALMLMAAPLLAREPMTELTKSLRAANIPIDGVNKRGPNRSDIEVVFKSGATAAQVNQATSIVASFDLSTGTYHSEDEITAAFKALTPAQQQDFIASLIGFAIKDNSVLQEKLGLR